MAAPRASVIAGRARMARRRAGRACMETSERNVRGYANYASSDSEPTRLVGQLPHTHGDFNSRTSIGPEESAARSGEGVSGRRVHVPGNLVVPIAHREGS